MKFVADENIDRSIIEALVSQGHEVVSIASDHAGEIDDQVLGLSAHAGAVLITGDKDFGDLVYRMGRASGGVILVRLLGLTTDTKAKVVSDFVLAHGNEIAGNFCVLTPGTARIRKPG